MLWMRKIALALLGRYGARLRFPHLMLLSGLFFVMTLLIPDALPFVDELLLALLTMLFASWKNRADSESGDGETPAIAEASDAD